MSPGALKAPFFIQKSARHIGVWRTLFFIGLAGLIILLPFVKDDLPKSLLDFYCGDFFRCPTKHHDSPYSSALSQKNF